MRCTARRRSTRHATDTSLPRTAATTTVVAAVPAISRKVTPMFFGDFWWFLLWSFYFIAYLYVVIVIITDLFRDENLNGWLKALWIIALVFVPFLTALVYIIARGKGMAARAQAARGGVVPESDDYHPAASSSP